MRLPETLKSSILKAIEESFGNVEIYLFGSRTDDTKRGGDIDIAIRTDMTREHFRKHKIAFVSLLMRMGFDLKIDLVQYHDSMDALLKSEICSNGIKL
ncbi:MAG: nucleotidyltransferase domain-containing protein [Sulfuricurvum sp.]|uniref:nucleotidyltransferase domain-containing protein n=1 Tax=Sulfuricurvum sp. TaxID=2025608 RepID=UPI00260FC5E6|nr:nucleotidyltransferase domain-containing protein [Sulfuricurvum sp.]MDD5158561.1 nucleotidyltransferase domain-containing protein [Sulfuricurvum sp.]